MTTLTTFMASMQHAVRNNDTVTIGGGQFTPAELRQVIDAIKRKDALLKDATEYIEAADMPSCLLLAAIEKEVV